MAVEQTTRLGITRWTDELGADPFRRSQLDGDHERLEAIVAGWLPDSTVAARPAPAAANARMLHRATDTGELAYSDGATWTVIAKADTVSGHLTDPTDAHDASAISFAPTGSVAATDVQAAIAEVDAEKETPGGAQTKVDTHNADTTGVHGIADTAALETTAGAQAKADAAQTAAETTADNALTAHAATVGAGAHVDQQPAIADLALVVTDPPTQAEVQAVADKVDAVLAALRGAGQLAV